MIIDKKTSDMVNINCDCCDSKYLKVKFSFDPGFKPVKFKNSDIYNTEFIPGAPKWGLQPPPMILRENYF